MTLNSQASQVKRIPPMQDAINKFISGRFRPSDKEGGQSHPDPEIRWGPGLKKNFFSALQASVWSKNKGGGPPGSSTVYYSKVESIGSCRFQIHLCILLLAHSRQL